VNNGFKLLLLILVSLLAKPDLGFSRQAPAAGFDSLVAAAEQAQATGDYATAASDYRQAVRIRPDMPELWANLGLMQQETGNIPAALESFQNANRLDPSLYVPNLFMGIDYAHTGKTQEAIPFLIEAEKINRADPQAPLALGRVYISAQKYSAAARELDRATGLSPKLGPAWFAMGIARLDQVEADARTMADEGKKSPYAEALFAESLVKQARFEEAATLYKSLLGSQPQPPCIRSEMGFALLRGHDRAGAADAFAAERAAHPECGLALLGQARLAMENGDTGEAARLLIDLWDRDRGFFESNAAVFLAGLSSEKAATVTGLSSAPDGRVIPADLRKALLTVSSLPSEDASDSLTGLEPAGPAAEDAPATSQTAEELYAAGRFRQCELRLGSNLAALSVDQLRLLAACSFFTGDYRRTYGAASALARLQPHSLEGLYWSIKANERLALRALARFQQLDPGSATSHVLLGDIDNQLERYDDAQSEYQKALAIAPGDPAAMLGLASADLNIDDLKDAMDVAQSALARTPDDPELNLIMAEALISKFDYAQSVPYLIKSLHAKPQMLPRIHALIGRAYAETGRTQEAIEELKLGASSDEDGSVQYLLARLYRKLGDTKDAIAAINRMKVIKQQREARGVKRVEDPDLSPLESSAAIASAP
jgi:tetratricopeptide (TPR) repeat protein